MKVYGLPESQGRDRQNDMARAAGKAFIAPEAKLSIDLSAVNSFSDSHSLINLRFWVTACRMNFHMEINTNSGI